MSLKQPSTYKWIVELPDTLDRDAFITSLWKTFQGEGLLGIHEGTILTDQAVAKGFETEPWIVDSGLAPEQRDWISELSVAHVEIHTSTRVTAEHIRSEISRSHPDIIQRQVEELPAQDWDAEWKKNFQGIEVKPNWWILPPWKKGEPEVLKSTKRLLWINPGAGFGTGTHPTTQLCLETLTEHWANPKETLDFGSGSGILSIAAAILGSRVIGCEIDELANDNARENAAINEVADKVEFQIDLPPKKPRFGLLIANILKPILLEYCDELVARIEPGAPIVLSGLIEPDLAEIIPTYQKALGVDYKYQVHEKDEWRSVYWWKEK